MYREDFIYKVDPVRCQGLSRYAERQSGALLVSSIENGPSNGQLGILSMVKEVFGSIDRADIW